MSYIIKSNQISGYSYYNTKINIYNDTALYLYNITSQWASTKNASLDLLYKCINYLKENNLLPSNACYTPGGEDPAEALKEYFNNNYVNCSDSIDYIGSIGKCPACQSLNEFCIINIFCRDNQSNIIYNGNESSQKIDIKGVVYAVNVSLCSYNQTEYNCQITKEVNNSNGEVIYFNYNCQLTKTNSNCVFSSNPECKINNYCNILSESSYTSGDTTTYNYNVNIYEQNIEIENKTYIGLSCSVYLPCCPLPPKDSYPSQDEIQSLCNIDP